MTPSRLLHLEMLCFLYVLAATIAVQILTGRIRLVGLLSDKGKTRQLSAGRVQLLMASVMMCISYLDQVANATGGAMPDVSTNWLYVFGGSGGIYTLEKAWTAWKNKTKSA
jgi:hypothetical protein